MVDILVRRGEFQGRRDGYRFKSYLAPLILVGHDTPEVGMSGTPDSGMPGDTDKK